MNKKKTTELLFNIFIWTFNVVIVSYLIKEKAIPRMWAIASVRPSVTFSTPLMDDLQPFEYCVLQEDSGLANQINAGTPVPMQPVYLGPTPTVQVQTEPQATDTPEPGPTPTFEPTATQPVYDELNGWQVEVADMGGFKEDNFHMVIIGVGYTDEAQNEAKLREIISSLKVNFMEVTVDFAYVKSPLNLNLLHADQAVDFANSRDLGKLLAKIRDVYPVDSVLIAIETPSFLGTSDNRHFAVLTGSDPNSLNVASHETAHLLGLGDGYRAYYPERILPNSELFYLDSMPRILSDALAKLDSTPPMYEVGTCNGRKLYTFYERSNNRMSDYNPQGPNSWGDSLFTPLQIQVMNNFIATLK